jgi:hypothetical protein
MITISVLGNKYEFPHSLAEITLSRWIKYLEFVDQNLPKWMEEDEDEVEVETAKDEPTPEMIIEQYEYFCAELNFWTGCPISDLRRHSMQEIGGIWEVLQNCLTVKEDTGFSWFKCGGQIFYLKERLMSDATLEDYAEANEYEKQLSNAKNGLYRSLFYIAAIVCRKSKTEGFDDYDENGRAEFFKQHLTAYDAYQVGFFLRRLSEKFTIDFQIYLTARNLNKLKQVWRS